LAAHASSIPAAAAHQPRPHARHDEGSSGTIVSNGSAGITRIA
jgi:hypothetical protein